MKTAKASTTQHPGRLLTVKEASLLSGLAEITLRKRLAARALSCVRLGRSVRIYEKELLDMIAANTVPALVQ